MKHICQFSSDLNTLILGEGWVFSLFAFVLDSPRHSKHPDSVYSE